MVHAACASVTYASYPRSSPLNACRWQDGTASPTHRSSLFITEYRQYLIGSAAIKNGRNSHENTAITFSNRSKNACFNTRFSPHKSQIISLNSRLRGVPPAGCTPPTRCAKSPVASFLIASEANIKNQRNLLKPNEKRFSNRYFFALFGGFSRGDCCGHSVAFSFQRIWRIMAVHMVASREGRFRRRTRRRMRSSASATVRRSRKPLELRAWVRMAVKRSISAAVAGSNFSSARANLAAALASRTLWRRALV